MAFLVTDRDYYQPWDTADPGPRYHPGPLRAGWQSHDVGPWTHWGPSGLVLPDQGWKVHVSSSLVNAQPVLTVVATACADLGVAFKHLAGRRMFVLMHDKHAARVQAGKFCALYPPTQQCALELMQRLSRELSGVSGPFVLTDRRFGTSECVSYRYGGFRSRARVNSDGMQVHFLVGPDGTEIEDERRPEFHLPAGLSDPFREQQQAASSSGPVTLHGYRFESAIQHSNAGGAYRFRSERGERVFVKEARAHNGYTSDGVDAKSRLAAEFLTLQAIHGREPGLCPRPVELFHEWEHSYLVTELVSGVSLYQWMIANNAALETKTAGAALTEYYRRGLNVLDQLDKQLRRLHELGFVFIDVSPNNVLVDDDDRVRLIDFEGVQPIAEVRRILGTPGYQHPEPRTLAERDPRELDRYGLAALALLMLFPLHDSAERHPAVLDHLHADLLEIAPIPPRLWQWATTYYRSSEESVLPTPDVIRQDTTGALRWLADRTADWLEAVAQPDHPGTVYPTSPMGYETNTRALAAGTAGVLYALNSAGRQCDPAVIARLRNDSLAALSTTGPGLLVGNTGIAWVLAELGEPEAAETLFAAAAAHPLNDTSATFSGGAAGTAYGLLAHYRRTGDQRWLDCAQRLLERIPEGEALDSQLNPTRRSGLVGGRSGVALALHQLYRVTGDPAVFDRGFRLLADELRYAEAIPVDALAFRAADNDRRLWPYLFAGSAGYAEVLSRYLADRPDARFEADTELSAADALERCLRACAARFAALPGLFPGLAGLAVCSAAAGRRLNRPELVDSAMASARGLFRYAVPRPGGVGWLGEPGQRLSGDLWSGAAGILIALGRITEPESSSFDVRIARMAAPEDLVRPLPDERRDHHGGHFALAD
jgi:tRNA A-37 threonylcarbamoyl transferase component Bud32